MLTKPPKKPYKYKNINIINFQTRDVHVVYIVYSLFLYVMTQTNLEDEPLLQRILDGLNTKQRQAVESPSNERLQIIAGPGTGKTKVLISRVAYLLIKERISPQRIIVTTFTKKAANEMIERLKELLGDSPIQVDKLLIGTFHSICFRIIKIYGKKIGISDYNIADERDSKQILEEVITKLTDEELKYIAEFPDRQVDAFKSNKEEDKYHGWDPKKVRRQISKLKSSGIGPDIYEQRNDCNQFLGFLYSRYQKHLKQNLLLDFDDCLTCCYHLITTYPVLNFVEHVLVDEFQDTNEIQLQLMYEFARGHPSNRQLQNNVTIVGDPDQSIYAFRDAQAVNFKKMKDHYKKVYPDNPINVITLEENYRSTTDILSFSEKIMRQQNDRLTKSLKSQMTSSFRPVYSSLKSPEQEARWIAYQIEHLMALPNSIFKYSDISILVRSAYQTRTIENEFVRKRIPYLMVKGIAFWNRKEVVAILDYMRVISADNDRIAYLRTINFPKRGIGEKTLALIENKLELESLNLGTYKLIDVTLRQIANGCSSVKISAKNQANLTKYLDFIKDMREILDNINKLEESQLPTTEERTAKLTKLFELIYVKSGLQKEFQNDPNHELNIMEVQTQLCEFKPKEEELPLFLGGKESDITEDRRNFLQKFIQSIGLYETDSVSEKEKERSINEKYPGRVDRGKVSISTIHGSKGLEWPIVFVPGLSEGILPAKFAMDTGGDDAINEERRCFYVATTRTKLLLYISSFIEQGDIGKWGRKPVDTISRFIGNLNYSSLMDNQQNILKDLQLLSRLYKIVDKPLPTSQQFNFTQFGRAYELRLNAYISGETEMNITEEVFKNLDDNTINSDVTGFSSARLQIDKKRPVKPITTTLQQPKRLKDNNQSSINSFFKAPTGSVHKSNLTTQITKGVSNAYKVPTLTKPISNRAPTISKVEITKTKNNKAPPYIPVRKVPSRILNRRRNINS